MTSIPDVPPFVGYVETTSHALRLIFAARQGVIPRITRRLNDAERRTMIRSGAVFVFSVDESGIKRWTDGLLWSPSRIVGNFLVYREINERTSSRGSKKTYPLESPTRCSLGRRNSPDHPAVTFKGPGHLSQGDHGATFKVNGLIKKTITVTIEGSDLHLISYYTSEDIRSGRLKKPTSRLDIMSLYMPPHIFRLTNFRVPPKIETGPDGKQRLACEAEDLEQSDCKLEEPVYNVSGSMGQWTPHSESIQHSPRTSEDSYPAGAPYQDNHSHTTSPVVYNREVTADKWPISLENLRIAPISRQDLSASWASSSSPTHSQSILRRRDSHQGHTVGAWLTSHPPRYRSDGYGSSPNPGLQLDRTRGRSTAVHENPDMGNYRQNTDAALRIGPPTEYGDNDRESSSRLAWPREVGASDLRTAQVSSSFAVASPPMSYSQNHPYPRINSSFPSWSSSDSSNGADTPLHQIASIGSYESSYASSTF